jgi:hypothetical protein
MSVHCARLVEPDPDTGEPRTFWFAATDETGSDSFLPVNQPAVDADETEVAALFDTQPPSEPGGHAILYMRIHRAWLTEKGAEFLTPEQAMSERLAIKQGTPAS